MPWVNFHTHTSFCDGISHPEGYILQAIDLGMPAYGFSGHAPMPFATKWAISNDQLPHYLADIAYLKQKYAAQITLYTALEVDYIPSLTGPSKFKHLYLDYLIGAVHFVGAFPDGKPFSIAGQALDFSDGLRQIYDNKVQKLAERYFQLNCELLQQDTPDILAHADLIKNNIQDTAVFESSWYQNSMNEMIDLAHEKDCIIEVNTRGWYKQRTAELYPSIEALQYIKQKGVRILLSADTHLLSELCGGFTYAAGVLLSHGFKEVTVFKNGQFEQVPLLATGIHY